MSKPVAKESINLKVNIQPGPASQAQKALYRKFWAKLISQVLDGVKNER